MFFFVNMHLLVRNLNQHFGTFLKKEKNKQKKQQEHRAVIIERI